MNETRESGFLLQARNGGRPPVLAGVEADARLDGVLLTLTLRQRYRNESAALLEVVYTFPLPHDAVLLEFAAELGGQRRQGVIVPRAEAEQTYESALADGDLPALLETSGDGIHTANIGNLKPGEEAVLEIRTAQWLAFDHGRLRIAIPTTIAPRYGDPACAGLQPHQVPPVSMATQHPLALSLTLGASLADAVVSCPTHATSRERTGALTRVSLQPGAALDRDVVFTVTPPSPYGGVLVTGDDTRAGSGYRVSVAAFEMPRGAERASVRLRLLVDCSGSMNGDSIASAREALRAVLAGLTEADEVGLSRFGSDVDHVWAATPCTPVAVRRLQRLIDGTAASMGGTEMENALAGVFDTILPKRSNAADAAPLTEGVDVLLITDGEVYDMPDIVRSARPRGHRVFAIGVGSAPAGGALQQLVDATGGACEFVSPGEDMQDAATRMLRRMRQQHWDGVQVDWGAQTTWRSEPQAIVFGGDTMVVMAGFDAGAGEPQPRLVTPADGGPVFETPHLARSAETEGGDTLARLGASRRLRAATEEEALGLAVGYRLLTQQTHCVLVHPRAEADKCDEEAELHRVASMLAAGWGGNGTVLRSAGLPRSALVSYSLDSSGPSLSMRAFRSPSGAGDAWALFDRLSIAGVSSDSAVESTARSAPVPSLPKTGSKTVPASVRATSIPPWVSPPDLPVRQTASLRQLMVAVANLLGSGGSLNDVSRCCLRLKPGRESLHILAATRQLGVADAVAWLLLAYWVALRPGREGDTVAAAVLRPHAGAIAQDLRTAAWTVFDRELASCPTDAPASQRQQRLAKALRSGG
jgi:Ca-activated chloride channel family protein